MSNNAQIDDRYARISIISEKPARETRINPVTGRPEYVYNDYVTDGNNVHEPDNSGDMPANERHMQCPPTPYHR